MFHASKRCGGASAAKSASPGGSKVEIVSTDGYGGDSEEDAEYDDDGGEAQSMDMIGETSRTPLPSLPSGPSIRVMLDGGGFSTGSVHLSPEAMIPGDDSGLDEESAEEIDDTMKW